jgi:hypothetical protein
VSILPLSSSPESVCVKFDTLSNSIAIALSTNVINKSETFRPIHCVKFDAVLCGECVSIDAMSN